MTPRRRQHAQSLQVRFRHWARDHEVFLALQGFSRRLWLLHAALAVVSFIGLLATALVRHWLPGVVLAVLAGTLLSLAAVVELNLPRHPLPARAVTACIMLTAVLVLLAVALAVAG